MAVPSESKLVIKRYDGFGGNFVDSQYLGASYDADKPHMFQNTLAQIYASKSQFFNIKPLTSMLGTKNVIEIDNEIYRWTLQGAETRTARVVELLDDANTTPGLNGTTFRIKLDIDYYQKPDVLLPQDNSKPLAIVDGPIQDGSGYIYHVRIQTDNPAEYLPQTNLQPGARFTLGWTSVASEANGDFGTHQTPSSYKLENQVSFFANKMTVTDRARRREGYLGVEFMVTMANGETKKVDRFVPFYEARMWDQFYKSMEVQAYLGKRSNNADNSGYWIKTGAGLREQLKDGWTQTIPGPLTTTLLKDYLMSIFFARNDASNRSVKVMTGTLGALLFHEALANTFNGFLTVDTHFLGSMEGIGGTPGLAYGAQFRRYRAPQGVVVDLIHTPLYDAVEYCQRFHPLYPAYPIDSARFTFMDFAMDGTGQSNVSMVRVKDSFVHGYTQGLIGPKGPNQGGMMSGAANQYDVVVQGSQGLWMKDVTMGGTQK